MSEFHLSEEILNSFRRKPKKHQTIQTEEKMSDLDKIETDLNKVRLENLKLQKQLKQCQDNIAINANNQNNTSSKFMLPSEFKNKYESMVKESLPTAFVSLFDQPKLLIQVIQQICLFLESFYRNQLQLKTTQIANIIGSTDNGLSNQLLKLYQDNYSSLLIYDSQLPALIKQNVKCKIPNIDEWIETLDEDDFIDWIKQYQTLLSYIILSDQELNLGFSKVQYEIVQYSRNDYYCVDGFGKDGMKCLVILPPIMRKQHPFNGIKHAVLILPANFDCSVFDSELKIEDLAQELRTYNSPKQIVAPKENTKQESQQQEDKNSKTFFSQRSETKEECRLKPHPKQVRKGMQLKDTLKQLNTLNEQSLKDVGKLIRQQNNPKQIQSTFQQSGTWQNILKTKQNKENLNQSHNSSFHGFTIQQLIKKIQIDGSKPLIKKGNQDSKFIKSFCQSQQATDRQRTRAQSNDSKPLKCEEQSPFRIYKI